MSFLSDALRAVGYKSTEQQIHIIQLYHASGALTNGTVPEQILSNEEVLEFIRGDKPNALTFEDDKEDLFKSPRDALRWLNDIGQKQRSRFRPVGTERQQMTTPKELEVHSDLILDKFRKLGFLDEVVPVKPDMAALLILGAAQGGVESRFDSAAQMIEAGKIRPGKIIIVSGARDLWPADTAGTMRGETSVIDILEQRIKELGNAPSNLRESLQSDFDQEFSGTDPKNGSQVVEKRARIAELISNKYNVKWPTEADMMGHLAHQHPVLSKFEICIVNAPKISVKRGQEQVLERPNTQSTLQATVRQHGQELMCKDVAVMSSQPHSKYQQGVVNNVMGQQYNIHMIAPKVKLDDVPPELILVGLEAVYASVYSSKMQAEELLKEQEEQDYKESWQDYMRERQSIESSLELC